MNSMIILFCSIKTSNAIVETIAGTIAQDTVILSKFEQFMVDTFFPNLKKIHRTVTWNQALPIALSLVTVAILMSFVLSYGMEIAGYNYVHSEDNKEEQFRNIVRFPFLQMPLLVPNGFEFAMIYFFCDGLLYQRLFASFPINLYFFMILNLLLVVFLVFYLLFMSLANSLKLMKGKKTPLISALLSILATVLLFCLSRGLIGSPSMVRSIVLANILVIEASALLTNIYAIVFLSLSSKKSNKIIREIIG